MAYPSPDPIGLWLFKWIVGPLIAVALIGWVIHFEVMKHKCRAMAEDRGYLEATYIPPNRAGFGEQCICRRRRNADGTVDEKAKLVINLD